MWPKKCDKCGREYATGVYTIHFDPPHRSEGNKNICLNCALDCVYLAEDAGLIKWKEAEGR